MGWGNARVLNRGSHTLTTLLVSEASGFSAITDLPLVSGTRGEVTGHRLQG